MRKRNSVVKCSVIGSILIAGTLITSSCTTTDEGAGNPKAARSYPREGIFNDNFEDLSTGSFPEGWICNDSIASVSETSLWKDDKRCVKFICSAIGDKIYHDFTTQRGEFVVEYMFRADKVNLQPAGYVNYSENSDEGSIGVIFSEDGYIKYYAGEALKSSNIAYETNTWYKIKYIVNTNSNTYNLYINSVETDARIPFRHSATQLNRIVFTGKEAGTTVYFDDVRVYTSDYLIHDNFQGNESGQAVPCGWTKDGKEDCQPTIISTSIWKPLNDGIYKGKVVKEYIPGKNDDWGIGYEKHIQLTGKTTDNPPYIYRNFAAQTDKIIVEYIAKAEQNNVVCRCAYLGDSASSNTASVCVIFGSDGHIKYHNGTDWQDTGIVYGTEAHEWYGFRYVIDISANTYDLYINSSVSRKYLSIPFRYPANKLDYIRLLEPSNSGKVCFDDIRVYNPQKLELCTPDKLVFKGQVDTNQTKQFSVNNPSDHSLSFTLTPGDDRITVSESSFSLSPGQSKNVQVTATFPDKKFIFGFIRLDIHDETSTSSRKTEVVSVIIHTERKIINPDFHQIKDNFYNWANTKYNAYAESGLPPYLYAPYVGFTSDSSSTGASQIAYIFLYKYFETGDTSYLDKAKHLAEFILKCKMYRPGNKCGFSHNLYTQIEWWKGRIFGWTHSIDVQFLLTMYIVTRDELYFQQAKEGIQFLKDHQFSYTSGACSEAYHAGCLTEHEGYEGHPIGSPGRPIPAYSIADPAAVLARYYLMTGEKDCLVRALEGFEYIQSQQNSDGSFKTVNTLRCSTGLTGQNIHDGGLWDIYQATRDNDIRTQIIKCITKGIEYWANTPGIQRKDGRLQMNPNSPYAYALGTCSYAQANIKLYQSSHDAEYLKGAWTSFEWMLQNVNKSLNAGTQIYYGGSSPDNAMLEFHDVPLHGISNIFTPVGYDILEELKHYPRPDFGENEVFTDRSKDDDNSPEIDDYFVRWNDRIILHIKDGLRQIFGYENVLWGEKRGKTALFGYVDGYFDESTLANNVTILKDTPEYIQIQERKENSNLRLTRIYTIESESKINVEEKLEVLNPDMIGKEYKLRVFISPIGYTVKAGEQSVRLHATNAADTSYPVNNIHSFTVEGIFPVTFYSTDLINIDIIDYKMEAQSVPSQGEEICIKQAMDKSNTVISYSFCSHSF